MRLGLILLAALAALSGAGIAGASPRAGEPEPGSTLFAVWTRARTDDGLRDGLEFRRSLGRLLTAIPDDIVLVKVSHHFDL